MNDRRQSIVRQYGQLLSERGDTHMVRWGVGWGARTTVQRLTEAEVDG
jgi:hypothetical protein